MSTFAYNGVVYDATTYEQVGTVEDARVGINAWVAAEAAQAKPGPVTPITFAVEEPHRATSIVDPFGEDAPVEREPLTGFQRLAHYEKVRAYWRLTGSMSLDPSETSDAEVQALDSVPVFGMHGAYETTPDSAFLDCKARFIVHPSGWVSERPAGGWLKKGFRRTFALDTTHVEASPQDGRAKVTEAVCDKDGNVILKPKRYWRNVKDERGKQVWERVSPEILPYDRGVEDDLMAWIHRDDVEINRARRARMEETADTSREWIKGAAAPKDLTEFDYERLLSNPDVAAKAARSGRGRLWAGRVQIQDRAFPGEQNLSLVLKQRTEAGDEVVSERMLAAWAESMRHRFNVRRYVEAISSAFGDDPREVFSVIDEGRRTKSTSWAKVESFVARQYEAFAESCYLSGVSDGVHGEWLSTGDSEQSEEWKQLINDGGFGTEYADIGHSLYQTRLVSTRRPTISGTPRTPYKSARPEQMRVRPASERHFFRSNEVIWALLDTVRRMDVAISEKPEVVEAPAAVQLSLL